MQSSGTPSPGDAPEFGLVPPSSSHPAGQNGSEVKQEYGRMNPGTSSQPALPIHEPVSVTVDPAGIEVKVEKVNECGVCGTVTTPLLKEDGKVGSVDGSYEMSQISPHGRVYKHAINEDEDTFWICCDGCQRWFHGRCVLVEEYQDGLIEKFHCPPCTQIHGPSRVRQVLAPHRLAFDDPSQLHLATEVGTKTWIDDFAKWEGTLPSPTEQHVTVFKDGYEFTEKFNRKENWTKVFLIKDPKGLELRMPTTDFTTHDLIRIFGENHQVDTIDVYRQVTHAMTLGAFHRRMASPAPRDRLYNFLSLEFSKNEAMKEIVAPPILVYELSLVHKFWPDKSDPINYDPDMDVLPESVCFAKAIEVAEEHKKSRPDVALFCLCGMGGSYTDFHIDFGGSSVWYHIYKGQKIFYIAEPTPKNLEAYEAHQVMDKRTEHFLGKQLAPGELRRVVINQGETLMIPSGWIHAVFTPVDSLVFGGNFLHHLNIPMQLRVYDIEQRTRSEVGTEEKFLFPQFELVHWYAARSILTCPIKEDNDSGKQVSDVFYYGAKAILPYLKRWLEKEEQLNGKQAVAGNAEIYKKLKKEFESQEKLRRDEWEGKKKKGHKKSKKKKSHGSDGEEDEDYKPLKLKISRSKIKKPRIEGEEEVEESPEAIETPRHSDDFLPDPIADDDEPHESFGMRFTKRGTKYSSELVEKATPMIGGINVASMFARRSSSGRAPKVAGWLAAAAGNEIEKKAKKLEEEGDMPQPREPVVFTKEMDALMAKEDREDEEYEDRKRKKSAPAGGGGGKISPENGNGLVGLSPAPPKKKAATTAKQRLASKLGLLKK